MIPSLFYNFPKFNRFKTLLVFILSFWGVLMIRKSSTYTLSQVFLIHVYKNKLNLERTMILAIILLQHATWGFEKRQSPRGLSVEKGQMFPSSEHQHSMGSIPMDSCCSLPSLIGHYSVTVVKDILNVSSTLITIPPDCVNCDKFTKWIYFVSRHSQLWLQLIRGLLLTLMCFQWNTCNYFVCEGLQVLWWKSHLIILNLWHSSSAYQY